jgi:hypothetical protein
MSNHRINRLVQLNAIADRALEINFARYEDDDESHMARNAAIGGVGLAGASYARGRYIQPNQPGGLLSAAEAQPGFRGAARRHYGTMVAGGKQLVLGDTGLGRGIDKYNSLRAGAAQGLGTGRGKAAMGALKAILSKFRK